MAIITEEEEEEGTKTLITPKDSDFSKSESTMKKNPKPQSQNPFPFWFYFTLIFSLATIIFTSLSLFSSHNDPRSWFLSLPPALRQHYSDGRTIKVQVNPDESPIEVFVAESGSVHTESVVIVHGLGLSSFAFKEVIQSLGSKGIHGVAIDLPGNGFSDKSMVVIGGDREIGFVARVKEVYGLIQEKGVFWAFDQMVETGDLPYEEIIKLQNSKRRSLKAIELGSQETSRVLGQVIDTLGLAPVHLVLHDSALGLASNWVSENYPSVRSITLIDSSISPALPLWVLNVPGVREVLLGFSFGFQKLVSFRCSKEMTLSQIEAHRILLEGRNGREAVVASLKKLNHSFDIGQWGNSDGISGIPMQVIWSREGSKEWSEEGQCVAKALPKAKFATHSGSRWPQVSKSGELADYISEFVSQLPRSTRRVTEEPIPEKVQKLLEEAKAGGDHDHHHGHGHAHVGYTDAYGLGEEMTT
ncbi:PREDICTED: protein AUXIN RESPONSE 4 [Camelina sativa]|uniref:Protein AUXIN RESPONSE 4 n=1 Tax=Camelina sativa TaxID=90675 RepID=A0ABM0SR57_CAMSA|nr:PREDICTED: protein AUXIN RESPONSE 4 [Camelina sativa]